jgi:sugar lactone lactonase YvrE
MFHDPWDIATKLRSWLFLILLLPTLPLAADFLMWLDSPQGRGNPHDPHYAGSKPHAALSPTQTPTICIMVSVAGNGTAGYAGDGVSATAAELNSPHGVAVDSGGNIYVADTGNQRIRKIDASGLISTVAGNGIPGYSGDGGAAINGQLSSPERVIISSTGDLYISDSGNSCIRKVDHVTGAISTVAGNGSAGYSGDNGAAIAARLSMPCGLALDASGALYIADSWNQAIRKVSPAGLITTVAGNGFNAGAASLGYGGYIGDGMQATATELSDPEGVAVDSAGGLYIADKYNSRIRKVDSSGIISTLVGPANTGQPCAVTLDAAGNLFVADYGIERILKVNSLGIVSYVAGDNDAGYSGDGLTATSSSLNYPMDVAVDGFGALYIADEGNNRIRKVY